MMHLDFAAVQLPNGMRWFSEAAEPETISVPYFSYPSPVSDGEPTERLRLCNRALTCTRYRKLHGCPLR